MAAVPKPVLRLLDANLNRAREGLRVAEDTARFVRNDEKTYRRLRSLRHDLQSITASRYRILVSGRNSEADSGRRMKEGGRSTIADVVAANLRRAQEAVRVLEEYSKVFGPSAAPEFKKIRFQLYVEEKKFCLKP
jgi:thiamine-phosphate pyrophosphorylase